MISRADLIHNLKGGITLTPACGRKVHYFKGWKKCLIKATSINIFSLFALAPHLSSIIFSISSPDWHMINWVNAPIYVTLWETEK